MACKSLPNPTAGGRPLCAPAFRGLGRHNRVLGPARLPGRALVVALVWPGIRHTARKLWVDDLAYAERRYELRQRGEFPG
jgi:hypothetical protein